MNDGWSTNSILRFDATRFYGYILKLILACALLWLGYEHMKNAPAPTLRHGEWHCSDGYSPYVASETKTSDDGEKIVVKCK
jgi:hypothetical protein